MDAFPAIWEKKKGKLALAIFHCKWWTESWFGRVCVCCGGEPLFQSQMKTSIMRPFSQYIFSSLVHKGNLNKRFELQSSLILHILWAVTAICVKKIKRLRKWARKTGGRENTDKSYPPHMKWGNSLEIRFFFYYWKVSVLYLWCDHYSQKKKKNPHISKVLIWLIASS